MNTPHIEHIHASVSDQQPAPRRLWFAPLITLLVAVFVGGTIFSIMTYQAGVREAIRVSESIAYAEYLQIKSLVDIDTYYKGISVDGIALGGKTRAEAAELIKTHQQTLAETVAIKLQIDETVKTLTATEIGLADDSAAVLDQAWQIGRTSVLPTDIKRVHERYVTIKKLVEDPVDLTVSETFSETETIAQVQAFVDSKYIAPKPATATSFDPATETFQLAEREVGFSIDQADFQNRVLEALRNKNYQPAIATTSVQTVVGMTAAEMRSNLALLGTATTSAVKVDPPRDNNLLKACEYLNDTIVQPGATFSFNKSVGKRTAERGFLEAGAITDGTLIKEYGGGICQVNTTVMQATMKSDYKLVERYPHSWPSSYTKIGLDATVTWGGADFKFQNNTDYPAAIVATYVKPNLTVKVYGRKLEEGLTISLKSIKDETIPVEAPIRQTNNALAPGQVVVIRAAHIGQRATAYKVYSKNGVVVKEVVLFKSYYRPIQGILDVGPAVTNVATASTVSASAGLSD
jgi:vancomycin resistance protein YoaR